MLFAILLGVLEPLLDLVLPRRCLGCEAPASGLCPECVARVAPVRPGVDVGVPVAAGGAYAGAVRAALLRYKERGRRDLAGPLAALLARALAELAVPGTVLVPVPGSRAVAAERGGDHVLRLARRVARPAGLPVGRVLSLARAKQDSAALDAAARARNLAGAFAARAAPPSRPTYAVQPVAIVVDDIVTTGATLREAVRALQTAGWTVAGAAVVAATPRRSSKPPGIPLAAPSAPV